MDTKLNSNSVVEAPKPSEAEVVEALAGIEKASQSTPEQNGTFAPAGSSKFATDQSWLSRRAPLFIFVSLAIIFLAAISWLALQFGKQLAYSQVQRTNRRGGALPHASTDQTLQAEVEGLLQRVVAGEPGAADQLIAESGKWTGKTQRTPKTDQLITAGINARDMHAREAALQTQLALEGIPIDENGFARLEEAAGNPQQRTWALWLLGAIGNRGVDPAHAAKVIGAYLSDPDVAVRTSAVEGLALVGTDETIPMLLDRFRNDPSPAVQEQAACGMAEAGMYTHAQRMVAAASLVGWLDDSLLSPQQRGWAAQALGDISGQTFGANAAAWRTWYENSR